MLYTPLLAFSGMLCFAAGLWLFETGGAASRKGIGAVLMLCGAAAITAAVFESTAGRVVRLLIPCVYLGAAGLLVAAVQGIRLSRRGGAVLAELGTSLRGGAKIMLAVGAVCGIGGVVAQAFTAQSSTSLLLLVGQGCLFTAMGARAILLARVRWKLSERGIVGPEVFIPWEEARGYEWNDDRDLVVDRRARFAFARHVTIPVLPQRREEAARVLAAKLS
jgi:hypothetical protein